MKQLSTWKDLSPFLNTKTSLAVCIVLGFTLLSLNSERTWLPVWKFRQIFWNLIHRLTWYLLSTSCMRPTIVYTLLNETDVVPHLMEMIDWQPVNPQVYLYSSSWFLRIEPMEGLFLEKTTRWCNQQPCSTPNSFSLHCYMFNIFFHKKNTSWKWLFLIYGKSFIWLSSKWVNKPAVLPVF